MGKRVGHTRRLSPALAGVELVGEIPDPDVVGLEPDDDIRASAGLRVSLGFLIAGYLATMRRVVSVTPSSMSCAEPRTSTPRSGGSDSATKIVALGSRRRCRAFTFCASITTLNAPLRHSW